MEHRLTTTRRRRSAPLPRAVRAPHFFARHLAPIALACVALSGCREGFAGLGTGPRARAAAEQAFDAVAVRHGDIVRNAKYEHSRIRLKRGALSPSRVFDDTAVWTGLTPTVRLLETFGTYTDAGRYSLVSRAGAPAPVRPADGRHVTTLARLSDSEYRWDTTVDYALGAVRPGDVAAAVSRLISSGEGRGEREVRADLATHAPRTSAALGSLFRLDSLRPSLLPDGTTAATAVISVHSERLRGRYPLFAEFVRKYIEPARYRFTLTDAGGTPFLDAIARDRLLTIRVRTLNGQMVPLAGAPRAMPDSLRLNVDFLVKIKVFRVGFHDLVMDFTNVSRGDRERSWLVVARREPKWNLPLITARLLRAPLRRPFAGEGASFRLGVRAGDAASPTVLVRQARLTVQESAILNFLNSLGNSAMDDFGERVEREEHAWVREVFRGLRDDVRLSIP